MPIHFNRSITAAIAMSMRLAVTEATINAPAARAYSRA
jgi:hypothetical protein